MGPMLAWIGKPDATIDDQPWNEFMGRYAPVFYLIVLTTLVVIVVMYVLSAKRRKVGSLGDVFAAYTPMYWILMAVPGGIVAAVLCFLQYPESFVSGRLGLSAEIFFLAGLMIALISYLLIAFVPPLTPAKFQYRPAPYLHRRKTVDR